MPDSLIRALQLGPALRRWRVLHRVKQSHVAEMFGVTQSTVSRWETGMLELSPAERTRLEKMLHARLHSAADFALSRLVKESTRPVHLVCDLSHRLLACSPKRAAEFTLPVSMLLGKSLWPYATEEIVHKEAALDEYGWRDNLAPASLEFASGENRSGIVPIHSSKCRWTRFTLSDGTSARLVETL